jgi:hypothetical protein
MYTETGGYLVPRQACRGCGQAIAGGRVLLVQHVPTGDFYTVGDAAAQEWAATDDKWRGEWFDPDCARKAFEN